MPTWKCVKCGYISDFAFRPVSCPNCDYYDFKEVVTHRDKRGRFTDGKRTLTPDIEVKTGKGKFRYESKKTRGGRLYIPANLTKHPLFPFKNGSTATITISSKGYLIVEPIRNMRIEPVNRSEDE